ncbi:hypothetical protein DASB73_000770 [Starmerella bacillaris]|uniref:Inositol polyphosphate-related phosphatase domain-containing protein n=1 Tax=Starmerella bacillaris TaxID=1247836 RepID=A0AAV5RC20_STABA|nr:hypothetical protein DASB73_000770 [Starmerella bacillaris]
MLVRTSSHELTLDSNHRYTLSVVGGQRNSDSWLESRRGEAFNRTLQARLVNSDVQLLFEHKPIGFISSNDSAGLASASDFIANWNMTVGPTDMQTIKVMELVKCWSQLMEKRGLDIRCCTYNCAGYLSSICLDSDNLSALVGSKESTLNKGIIVLSFQETDNLKSNLTANQQTLKLASQNAMAYLSHSHTLVSSNQLLGIMTLVFVNNNLANEVSNVETSTTSTGLLGIWANKGATLTRFNLFSDEILGGGVEFSIVNCHLSAGEDTSQLKRRRWELQEISTSFKIPNLSSNVEPVSEVDSIDSDPGSIIIEDSLDSLNLDESKEHELELSFQPDKNSTGSDSYESDTPNVKLRTAPGKMIIFMGDMNYRVLLTDEDCVGKVKRHEYTRLLAHDSLQLERRQGEILKGFQEPLITFPPTFKYEIGSKNYKDRVPSYTDRILYRTSFETIVQNYTDVDLLTSDHKPVALDMHMRFPCIDPEKRSKIIEDALKIKDEAENKARPILSVEPQQLLLKGPVLTVAGATISIRNDGTRPLHWSIECASDSLDVDAQVNSKAQIQSQLESLSADTSTSATVGVMKPLARAVTVNPTEGNISMAAPAANIRLSVQVGVHPRDLILLIKTRSGKYVEDSVHKYIAIKIDPNPSYLGRAYDDVPNQDVESHATGSVSPQLTVMKPVVTCCTYLEKQKVKDMFTRRADSALFQQVLATIDSSNELDMETLAHFDSVAPNGSTYAVAEVLLDLVRYMPWPIPQDILDYLLIFLKRIEKRLDSGSMAVWAQLLYPDTDSSDTSLPSSPNPNENDKEKDKNLKKKRSSLKDALSHIKLQ